MPQAKKSEPIVESTNEEGAVEKVVEDVVEAAVVKQANLLGVPTEVTAVAEASLRHLTFCQHISALVVLGAVLIAANVLFALYVHKV